MIPGAAVSVKESERGTNIVELTYNRDSRSNVYNKNNIDRLT